MLCLGESLGEDKPQLPGQAAGGVGRRPALDSAYPERVDVIDWLLEGDPAIRWQVRRDLLDSSAEEVAAERALVEQESELELVQLGRAEQAEQEGISSLLLLLRHAHGSQEPA